jgi:phosphoglycolate phosphatase-like HAD superfamily hydrolase
MSVGVGLGVSVGERSQNDTRRPWKKLGKYNMRTLILFDVDGTLIYSERRDSRCFAQTYADLYGRPFPSIDWRRYPHVSDTTIIATVIQEHFQRPIEAAEMNAFKREYEARLRALRAANPQHFYEVPGAARAVQQLLEHPDYHVAVATGGWKHSAEIKMQHVGIPCERFWVSGADDKYTREDILNEAISAVRQQEPQVQRVVYVGDAAWDVHTTRRLQLDFLGIRHGNDPEVLQSIGATQVLRDFLDFGLFLKAIAQATPPLPLPEVEKT